MPGNKMKRCANCGKRFRYTTESQKYCSPECRKAAEKRRRAGGKVEDSPAAVPYETVESALSDLAPVLECVPESKRSMADDVARDLAFLAVSCSTMRVQLAQEGFTDRYSNGGGQEGSKQSPVWLTYNQALRQKRDFVKLLAELAEGDGGARDALTSWQESH